MKIIADENIPLVREAFSSIGETTLMRGRSIDRSAIAGAEMLLVRSVTPICRDIVSGTPVRFVASATAGIEHIDISYLEKNEITFAYAPGSNANSVAEYVVAALLVMETKRKKPLSDCSIGIIGVGNVGSLVRKYASALGMRCLLNDPPRAKVTGDPLFRPLEEIIGASDFITLHVPLETTGEYPTAGMVNRRFLEKLKPGAVLINSSRGGVVNEADLNAGAGRLGGLVLDVWNHEPAIDAGTCAHADIATPHIAGYSYDGKLNGTLTIYRAACTFLGLPPIWNPTEFSAKPVRSIDVSNASDPLSDAVREAYPIMRDDAALRNCGAFDESKRGICFDTLRARYPKRLEFRHFEVCCSRQQAIQAATLEKLGFQVTIHDS